MAAQAEATVGNFDNVADGSSSDVPFTLHFQHDQDEHHLTSQQLCQMAVINNAATLHATGISITGGHNMNSAATTISVLQGHPEDAKPLPTISRQYVVTPRAGDGPTDKTAVIATHALLQPGYNSHAVRHEFVSGLKTGAAEYTHPDHLDEAEHQSLIKKSLLWSGHLGVNAEELNILCITDKKGVIESFAVQVIPYDSTRRRFIKLVARNLEASQRCCSAQVDVPDQRGRIASPRHDDQRACQQTKRRGAARILSAADVTKATEALESNLRRRRFRMG